LWDVTDKDIDAFSFSVLDFMNHETLPKSVAKARNVCMLKYLNGAAPIIYGVYPITCK
jgi:separase